MNSDFAYYVKEAVHAGRAAWAAHRRGNANVCNLSAERYRTAATRASWELCGGARVTPQARSIVESCIFAAHQVTP